MDLESQKASRLTLYRTMLEVGTEKADGSFPEAPRRGAWGPHIIILVSMLLAFLSGMNVRRRIVMNLVIIAAAVGVTYLIGAVTKRLWGISVSP